MLGLLALNPLGMADIVFFIAIAAVVVLCIIVYFLIPVINRKQYKEQRDNLRKREVAFKSNIRRSEARTDGEPAEGSAEEPAPELSPAEMPTDRTENEEK